MATRGATQFTNRSNNVGGGAYGGNQRVVVDDAPSGESKWLLMGMIFFAIVCFVLLPVVAMMLIDVKKTNVSAQAALLENRKLEKKLEKILKKDPDDE